MNLKTIIIKAIFEDFQVTSKLVSLAQVVQKTQVAKVAVSEDMDQVYCVFTKALACQGFA